jgi:preprotein translocase subunit YajC
VGGLRRTGKVAVVHQGDEVLQQSGIHASIMQDAHQKAINNALDD